MILYCCSICGSYLSSFDVLIIFAVKVPVKVKRGMAKTPPQPLSAWEKFHQYSIMQNFQRKFPHNDIRAHHSPFTHCSAFYVGSEHVKNEWLEMKFEGSSTSIVIVLLVMRVENKSKWMVNLIKPTHIRKIQFRTKWKLLLLRKCVKMTWRMPKLCRWRKIGLMTLRNWYF